MRTKIAEAILKENSKAMTKLTGEYSKMALELRAIKLKDPLAKEKARTLLKKSEDNRIEWTRLQAEVTALVMLEGYLPAYVNPYDKKAK